MPEPTPEQERAEAPTEREVPPGVARLRDALTRPSRSQVVVAVLLAVVGFAGIVQVRTTAEDDTYSGYREQDLIDLLTGLAGTTQRAETEIARLEDIRDDLRSSTTARSAAIEEARREARALEVLAGTVPVGGPGIRVTIEEDRGTIRASAIVDMVQELRSAGAEAIEINDQVRLVAGSWAIQDGDGIEVDGVPLRPPYVVEAIGTATTLDGAMSFPDGPTQTFERDAAATVEVDEVDQLEIASTVPDVAEPQFARRSD
ncbi:DUF881 domain-containing protein [Nocardioides zeae]|uniref:DUF881 domain-containing protein n=1 Tax=Nocardioides zeae TaxID=1457234 RepID=A0A6P0HIB6_9ACTN|nr:DUF881 domain-containing protein [Nocardioides zeae]NEN78383.1 DUF881 domain-containing protein [Nocardioides zeae]